MTTPRPAPEVPRTAPAIVRGSMLPHRWFGFLRGTLLALMPGLRRGGFGAAAQPAWVQAGARRRGVLLAIMGAVAALAFGLQVAAQPFDAGVLWWSQTVLSTLLVAWLASGFATALMGAWVLVRGDRHALNVPTRGAISQDARTAIIMPICNEDVATVFGGLQATAESLASTGVTRLFDFFILSDTSDPAIRAAELRAWAQLRESLGDADGGNQRIFYRWRRRRTKRKAGNVADFCRRWGRSYRYMVVFDADSTMRGDTLVSLVRTMEANPNAGIVQTLPQPAGLGTIHARMQQFASRVIGRVFALGMSYWQLGESHYWGHNAIIRVAPFMQHCGLGAIPGRGGLAGEILSHDFVEAAMMRRAGYEVWLAPQLSGSWEQHPANLLEELQRDRRWCQGNLQNARLIAEPGWRPVHRAMFAVGALSYAIAPVWLAFVAIGIADGGAVGVLRWMGFEEAGAGTLLWALPALVLALLMLPRALGVAAVLFKREQALYGGTLRLIASAVLELLLSALMAPVRSLAHTAFVLTALTGIKLDWKSPQRDDGTLAWGDALRRIGPLTLPALAASGLALLFQRRSAVPLLPWLVPLAAALPLTVAAGHARVGRAVQRAGLLATPEEKLAPRALARAGDNAVFARLRPPAPARAAVAYAAGAAHRTRPAVAFATCALAVAALLPHTAATPELPPSTIAERDLMAAIHTVQFKVPQVVVASSRPRMADLPPASRIDDAVRARAHQAVAQALENAAILQMFQDPRDAM